MLLETWLAYLIACAVFVFLVPGPTVMAVISYAGLKGKEARTASIIAVVLGDFTCLSLSLLGAGAILATSATLFTIFKTIGALYLVWVGIKIWRSPPDFFDKENEISKKITNKEIFWNLYGITALNPKSILFFMAFLPQFWNPALAWLPQAFIMNLTFLMLAAINIFGLNYLVTKARDRFYTPVRLKIMSRIGASFMIGSGIVLAFGRKA